SLLEELADRYEEHSPLRVLARGTRICRHVEAGDAEHSGRAHRLDERVEYDRGRLATTLVSVGLVTDSVDPLVGPFAPCLLLDLLGPFTLLHVDRHRPA